MAKDFSRPLGQRVRIVCQTYDAGRKTFKPVKNSAFLVTVADADRRKDLWKAIGDTIEGWMNGESGGGSDSSGDPGDRVSP